MVTSHENQELKYPAFFIKYQKKIWTRVQILILMILL